MIISYHRNFKKSFKKQPKEIQKKFWIHMEVFIEDQFHYSLNNHALTGTFKGMRSINITGDVRVHYEETNVGIILLDIGSHAELY